MEVNSSLRDLGDPRRVPGQPALALSGGAAAGTRRAPAERALCHPAAPRPRFSEPRVRMFYFHTACTLLGQCAVTFPGLPVVGERLCSVGLFCHCVTSFWATPGKIHSWLVSFGVVLISLWRSMGGSGQVGRPRRLGTGVCWAGTCSGLSGWVSRTLPWFSRSLPSRQARTCRALGSEQGARLPQCPRPRVPAALPALVGQSGQVGATVLPELSRVAQSRPSWARSGAGTSETGPPGSPCEAHHG